MTDKEDLEEAFMAGYVAARKAGYTPNELHPVTERAARVNFGRWFEMNFKDE